MKSESWNNCIYFLLFSAVICCTRASAAQHPELVKADRNIDMGKSKEAIAIVRNLTTEKNPPAEAFEMYPMILMFDQPLEVDQKEFQFARTAARMNPKSAHILATFAWVLGSMKKYDEATAIISKALKTDPKDARSHAIAAMLYKKVEDMPAAASQMEEALRLDSKSRDVNFLASRFYWETLEGKKLEETFKRWLKVHPNSALAHLKAAQYFRDMRRYEESISECKKAVALNENYMQARICWQDIALKQKRYKEAAELLTVFMKVCFSSYTTYSPRAECYAHLNEPQKAIDDYTKAIELRTPDLKKEGLLKLAKHMGKNEKKDQIAWWIARSQEYMKLKNKKKACEDMNLLVNAFPGSPSVIYARAKIFESAGMFEQALKDADKLISVDTDVTQWYRFKAGILKKMGNIKEAQKVEQRANAIEMDGK